MSRRIKDDAVQATRLLKGAGEPVFESSTRAETLFNQADGIFAKHPDHNIITASIYNAVSSHSKHTFSIWDVLPEENFILRYANPRYLQINGQTEDAFGKRLDDIFPAKIVKRVRRKLLDCVHHPREIEFVHDLFGGRMLATRALPQMDGHKVSRIICSGIDITDFVHEQNRLKAAGEQLEQQGRLLRMRLKFESLIARALHEFMDAGSEGFDGCLYGINCELGQAIGADRAFIFQKRTGDLFVHKAYWSRDDRPLYAPSNQLHTMQESGFNITQLTRVLAINDTHNAKFFSHAQNLSEMDIRALLAVPICRDSHDYGLLCFIQMNRPRIWTTTEISLAKTAANVIMSAWLRLHLETGLRENVRVLTEYDESLQELLAQKEALAGAAQKFLRTGMFRFAECACEALRDIGQLLDADGIRIFVRNDEDEDFYEWQEDGVPRRARYDHADFDAALQSATSSLRAPVAIDDTAEAHPLSDLVQISREEGLRSLLLIPSSRQDGLTGIIAFYKMIGVKYWNRADIISAEAFLDIFLDAYRLRTQGETCDALGVLL